MQMQMPEQKDLNDWEFDKEFRNASPMTDQLHNFPSLTMVKSMSQESMKLPVGGNPITTAWRSQASTYFSGFQEYADVVVAIESSESAMSQGLKLRSLRQLVPKEHDLLITTVIGYGHFREVAH